MNLVELAQRLKRMRLERGMTLEDVATAAGLTRGWLSKVENFRVTPSLPALSSIASVLGVTLSDLFEGIDDRPPLVVVRKDDRQQIRRDEEISEHKYESLAFPRPSREMDPFVLTVPPSDERPQLGHTGEEFMFVLTGSVVLEYGEDRIELEKADSAYFDGSVPHRVICVGEKAARLLIVYHGTSDLPTDGDGS